MAGAGRLDEAATEYQAYLRHGGRRKDDALTKLALIRGALGELPAAISCWQELFDANPRLMPASNNLAWLLATKPGADLEEALEPATNALAADPNNPATLDTVGWLHYLRVREGLAHDKRREMRRALDLLEQATTSAPHRSRYHYHYGLALALHGDTRKAERALRRALAMDPEAPFADHATLALERLQWSSR